MRRKIGILFVLFLAGPFLFANAPSVVFFQEATTEDQDSTQGGAPSTNVVGPYGARQVVPTAPAGAPGSPQGAQPPSSGQQNPPQGVVGTGPVVSGTGGVIPSGNMAPSARPVTSSAGGAGIKLNFSNAPIDRVIHSIMQELGYSYVIDPQVQGTVNIYTMREIPRDQLFQVLEQLLKMNGQAIVQQEDLYVIVPINESPTVPHQVLFKPSSIRTAEEGAAAEEGVSSEEENESESPQIAEPPAQQEEPAEQEGPGILISEDGGISRPGVITYIIPLHYIPSEQMLQMVQAFLSPGSTVVDFMPANMILVTDYRRNIEQVLSLVEMLDTRYFHVNAVDLIPIRFNKAADVAEDLGKIFAPGDVTAGVRIVAIERLNSVLVITRSADVFREVTKWIGKLDAPSSTSNLKTFVYQVENNTAVQIAQILAELYQDGSGLPSGPADESASGGAAGGSAALGERGANQTSRSGQRTPTRDPGFVGQSQFDGGRGFGGSGGVSGVRELGPALSRDSQSQIRSISAGNVKMVVNEFNNSLIIQGTEADIQFILDTVKQLDTLPRQVVIEAQIYSVELRDELSFGVAAFLQGKGAGVGEDGTVGPATTGSIGTDPPGQFSAVTRAIIGGEREITALLTALKNETDVQIVESPRILALDGTAASINVGAEVPVTSASFGNPLQSGTTNFVNSIQFRPTGTTLLIVPRISASGIVTMEVVLEVSSASGPALTPTINRNYIQSSFIVRDGQTVGIAGLISDSFNLSKNRVPLLGDIPIVGALFGQTQRDVRRAELIIFITPRVIRNLPTATELTLDFKRALRNAYDFIDEYRRSEEALIEERRQEEFEAMQEVVETPELDNSPE